MVVLYALTQKTSTRQGRGLVRIVKTNLAGTECEVANTSTPVFVITDKTLRSIEKLVENLKQLGIKDVNGELVYDEEEAGYENYNSYAYVLSNQSTTFTFLMPRNSSFIKSVVKIYLG